MADYQKWEQGSNFSFAVGFFGMEELKAKFEALHGQLSGPIKKKVLYAGAHVMARALQAAAPVGQRTYTYTTKSGRTFTVKNKRAIGQLRSSVIIYERQSRKLFEAKNYTPPLLVGFAKEKDKGFYAYWLEFGTRKMAARPFARPTFDANADAALAAMEQAAEIGLKEVA